MQTLDKQPCPFCHKKALTLTEDEKDIPYFGKVYLFSMKCTACTFAKSDVEAAEFKDPCKIEFTVEKADDMKVRVVKSSTASVDIPGMKMHMRPGPASEGFVSNIEGLLHKFKKILEDKRDLSDDDDERKKAKSLLKKLWKVECGDIPLKIVIEDPTGNSAIVSEKAKISKLSVKNK